MDSTKSVYFLIGKETVDRLNSRDLLYDDKTKEFQYEYNVITVCILNYFNAWSISCHQTNVFNSINCLLFSVRLIQWEEDGSSIEVV